MTAAFQYYMTSVRRAVHTILLLEMTYFGSPTLDTATGAQAVCFAALCFLARFDSVSY